MGKKGGKAVSAMTLNDPMIFVTERLVERGHEGEREVYPSVDRKNERPPAPAKADSAKSLDEVPVTAFSQMIQTAQGLAEAYAARHRCNRTGSLHRV